MRKTIFNLTFVLLATLAAAQIFAQKKDPVLMTIDGQDVKVSEFEAVYRKNNKTVEVDRADLEEYLELYINFKLKVREAEMLGMDTIKKFQEELKGYQKQLAKPYLTDKEVTEALIKEAYDRLSEDVRASHILIKVDPNALPKDTLEAYTRIMAIRKQILKGGDFAAIAKEKSEDPSAKENSGDLGFFTAMRMVYPFESAAYNTPVGELSMPVRTQFGYHLLSVAEKRPARGEILAAHIMIKLPENANDEQKAESKKKADEVYEKLKSGESFSGLAQQYSEDRGSAGKGGVLPWFGTGRMVKPFEDAAFALENEGDFSEPVLTSYGYHIIMLKEKRGLKSFEDMEEELRGKVAKDGRSSQSQKAVLNRIKKEYGFTEDRAAIDRIIPFLTQSVFEGKWNADTCQKLSGQVITIGDKMYRQADLAKFIGSHQARRKPVPYEVLLNSAYDAWVEFELLAYEESQLEQKYPEYKALLKEYRDGILLFDLTDKKVWTKAVKDTAGLEKYHKEHASEFMWGDRLDATVYYCNSDSIAQVVKGLLPKVAKEQITVDSLKKQVNAKSRLNLRIEQDKFEKGENDVVDGIAWKKGTVGPIKDGERHVLVVVHEVLQPIEKTLKEARGLVTAGYQDQLEKDWIKELRGKYTYSVNRKYLELIK